MMVAVFSNARTAICAKKPDDKGWTASFNCAFRAVRSPYALSRARSLALALFRASAFPCA
jgi:hypothetical protein